MTDLFSRSRNELPITASLLFFAGMLFVAVSWHAQQAGLNYGAALTAWGAVDTFAVWDGEWWRVFVSALHHGGILHLLMNASALWFTGGLIEPRLGPLRYALFVLGAMAVSGVAQSFWGGWVGLSGVAFAMFGLLLVWRKIDETVAERIGPQEVNFGLAFLFLCIPLTQLNILSVANVAHFAGFGYGWLAGHVFQRNSRAQWRLPLFASSHFLLIPAFYFLMHPVWSGSYYWRMADVEPDFNRKVVLWQKAVQADPRLDGPWHNLALYHLQQGQRLDAWRTIVQGIYHNRGYTDGIELARNIWVGFRTPEAKAEAEKILREIFGDEAPQWRDTLITQVDLDLTPLANPPAPGEAAAVEGPTRVEIPLRALDEQPPAPQNKLPPPNPNDPNSAAEGVRT